MLRRGGHRRGAAEGGRADRARGRPARRAAGAARLHARHAARPGRARRARLAAPSGRLAGVPGADRARARRARLPPPRQHPPRPAAALHALRRRLGRGRPPRRARLGGRARAHAGRGGRGSRDDSAAPKRYPGYREGHARRRRHRRHRSAPRGPRAAPGSWPRSATAGRCRRACSPTRRASPRRPPASTWPSSSTAASWPPSGTAAIATSAWPAPTSPSMLEAMARVSPPAPVTSLRAGHARARPAGRPHLLRPPGRPARHRRSWRR